jgi:hypothetical protein
MYYPRLPPPPILKNLRRKVGMKRLTLSHFNNKALNVFLLLFLLYKIDNNNNNNRKKKCVLLLYAKEEM